MLMILTDVKTNTSNIWSRLFLVKIGKHAGKHAVSSQVVIVSHVYCVGCVIQQTSG